MFILGIKHSELAFLPVGSYAPLKICFVLFFSEHDHGGVVDSNSVNHLRRNAPLFLLSRDFHYKCVCVKG